MSRAKGDSQISSLSDILNTNYPKPAALVEGLLNESETFLLAGKPKTGKSRLIQQLALCLSRAEPFLGLSVPKSCRLLYLDLENRQSGVKERFTRMTGGESESDKTIFLHAPETLAENGFVATPEGISLLIEEVDRLKPDVLIIDPWRLFVGGDENREEVVMGGLKCLSRLRQRHPRLAVVLIHHVRKQSDKQRVRLSRDPQSWIESASGHYSLIAHTDAAYGLERERSDDGEEIIVFAGVRRSGSAPVRFLEEDLATLRFEGRHDGLAALVSFTTVERNLWTVTESLRQFTHQDLIKSSGTTNRKTVTSMLRKAETAGLLTHEGKQYRVVSLVVPALGLGESGTPGTNPLFPSVT
jgi:hypothetical protein